MNYRLFFLNQDGWFEVDMTGALSASSIEDIILQAYKTMERHHYRNYRIMESSPRLFEPPLSKLERGRVVSGMNDDAII